MPSENLKTNDTTMSEQEKIITQQEKEKTLKQKEAVQYKVMEKLGFLPNNFDPKNYESPDVDQIKVLRWSQTEDESKDIETKTKEEPVTNAKIFREAYNDPKINEFAGKTIPENELDNIVDKIVKKMISNPKALILN
ncbi:MAG: hypothetical protein A2725_02300 [Candidatus Magasanikbacteria bacterium RIFCSPHIGHO2_01_FULL_33_34]|uniref:Uncharacterized protein n=1 Tax=Candidatus Magasanikbacteria bacterium RIFCSPHIGHO2_01_FULL_33_34 TaxID=1798671 RepID=A0A1F6LKG7_9BACT|nr:MAG: hypothetical protein A2725_02300 [Candidatus Magasanikbacteria bacterium RIFCSPHIGHO2_01_FULL_33_34]OGH65646.1 MAG: hypothetical protein A3B83_02100 [Candidatus Magasanikbacteria bacterium RIFCSPHIGHO2_02_FULL_33_17]OGH75855.1 MAG: hypothetical protein A3A89_02995 [Candidatus Magasanikbacteria bacterium RIFCSPLOWO2_01_FULL_33_34]OGH81134.1 MAG: hypothetical protein A3F93_01655 [Candidatus Magasanikbacteria bacterium RIFCSPLOWO2_12_FULL_34_7]